MNRPSARFAILVVLAAAFCAAVCAHVGIDVAGDYVLPDDSYDHLAHGSREIFTLVALLFAGGAAAVLLRHVLRAAASIPSRVRLLNVTRGYAVEWYLAVTGLALVLVPTMETIDAIRDGRRVESLTDAFGGSLLLGGGTTLICAAAICTLLFALVGWLCRHRERVARVVGALLARGAASPRPKYAQRSRSSLVTRARELRALRRGKRGPPLRSRFYPS
jgi:hypothetical protein